MLSKLAKKIITYVKTILEDYGENMRVLAIRLNNLNTNLKNNTLTINNVSETPRKENLPASDNYGRYIVFGSNNTESKSQIKSSLQALLKKENLDAVILAATDDYLSESLPDESNQIAHISGFTGDNGAALVFADDSNFKSRVYVDNRYYIQAEEQINPDIYTIGKTGLNDKNKCIVESLAQFSQLHPDSELKIGFHASQMSIDDFNELKGMLKENNVNAILVPIEKNPVDKIWKDKAAEKIMPVRRLPLSVTGETTPSKLTKVRNFMRKNGIDIFAVTNLSDIAYLTNMRGQDVDYNAVFKSKLLLTKDTTLLFCNPSKIPVGTMINTVEVKSDKSFYEVVEQLSGRFKDAKIALASDSNYANYLGLNKIVNVNVLDESPVAQMKAVKNSAEMKAYRESIRKTDYAITDLMNWINNAINSGQKISEKFLSDMTTLMHKKYGAIGLSFSTIPAVAENSALIHYENGNPNKIIKKGDLILVDTGAYYDSGQATDITRTWLAGGSEAVASAKQKEIYTATLKGALKGIFAELPPGTTGFDLDADVRNVIRSINPDYEFGHATGHGVGVEVHECPPFVTRRDVAKTPLKEGMIFSIEPGVYVEGFGGVRFENLVTVVKHSDPAQAKKGWHQIECLSFAPVDYNLIDKSMLNEQELKWLEMFNKKTGELIAKLKRLKK